jgi:hypothetical protein
MVEVPRVQPRILHFFCQGVRQQAQLHFSRRRQLGPPPTSRKKKKKKQEEEEEKIATIDPVDKQIVDEKWSWHKDG